MERFGFVVNGAQINVEKVEGRVAYKIERAGVASVVVEAEGMKTEAGELAGHLFLLLVCMERQGRKLREVLGDDLNEVTEKVAEMIKDLIGEEEDDK